MDLPIVNRSAELARLHALADAGGHRLALVTGRRRVGKTYQASDKYYFVSGRGGPGRDGAPGQA